MITGASLLEGDNTRGIDLIISSMPIGVLTTFSNYSFTQIRLRSIPGQSFKIITADQYKHKDERNIHQNLKNLSHIQSYKSLINFKIPAND